jgi:hypothetical protein
MAKMTIELSQFKSAGVYTIEVDQSERITVSTQSLRIVPGFAAQGPYNAPVFVRSTRDLVRFFGERDTKLERRGSFFHRSIETCLQASPVFAINLLKVNTVDVSTNTDRVGYLGLSLDTANTAGQLIAKDLFSNFFNRERFWKADPDYLQGVLINGRPGDTLYSSTFLGLVNTSTKDVSFIVRKAGNLAGFGITAVDWYGSEANIPYEWIRPYDYISDYFIQVIAVEGKWDNYTMLSRDPYFSSMFNSSGIIPSKINDFINSEQINLIGSWVGTIIPDFKDGTGTEQYIETIINGSTTLTGILCNINQEALDQLKWDETNVEWVVGDENTTPASYLVDLIGHNWALTGSDASTLVQSSFMSYDISTSANVLHTDISANLVDISGKRFTVSLADAAKLTVGSFVRAKNTLGAGLTRVTNKIFSSDDPSVYTIETIQPIFGAGAVAPINVKIQKTVEDPSICVAYKIMTAEGLALTNRHLPGFDENGAPGAEAGVSKIYGMLMEPGILRGLTNPDMIQYRYIVDTMAFGLGENLGGKSNLSSLAKKRGKCTAIISAPSMKQFATSQNPYFCDTYVAGVDPKPIFNTAFIATGGNPDMPRSYRFTLPTEDLGSKYCGVFGPFLTYTDNGKYTSIPPAADVSNTYVRKFLGGDPYAIVANKNGIISNANVVGVEYSIDKEDRDNLEPMGFNSIIERPNTGQIMIYANATAFQSIKSDYNNLHVRELLNTVELQIDEILKDYVFSYNNALTRLNIVNSVSPVFESLKDSGAIYKYEIVMDETNNSSDVIADGFGIIDFSLWITGALTKIIARYTVNTNAGIATGGFTS